MAGIIHMETDVVQAVAVKLDQTALEIHQEISALGNSIRSMNWQGGGSDEFFADFKRLEGSFTNLSEQGTSLSRRVKNEVAEWEETARQLEGSGSDYSNPLIIVGGGVLIFVGGIVWWALQDFEKLSSQEAENKIQEILKRTGAGRDAINKAEDLGVKFELGKAGKGTYYDPDTNTMFIDPKTNPDFAAESYIHELQHAQQNAEGRLPDAATIGRDEYTDRVIDIEAEALIKEYEYENERPVFDYLNKKIGEEAYEKTYRETINALKKSNPQPSAEEMHKLAYEAGKEEVKKLYRDGTIKASTNGKSYVGNAHAYWDSVNPPQSSPKTM